MIRTPGFVAIGPNGHVITDRFDYDDDDAPGSCREASIEDMEWAILKLAEAIQAARTPPYMEQTCGADFSEELESALLNEDWLIRDGFPYATGNIQ